MPRDKQVSVNQIYSVGHQTLDVRRAQFLENSINTEESFRFEQRTRHTVTRAYDPILQLEKRTEPLIGSKTAAHKLNKAELMRTHLNTVNHLNDNVDQLQHLASRKKTIAREIHLMEQMMGNTRMRDKGLGDPMSIEIVPQTSSFRSKLDTIQLDLDKSGVQFMKDAEHYAMTSTNAKLKYRDPDKTTLPVKPITPEKFDTSVRSFGGSRSIASTDYLNVHRPGSSSGHLPAGDLHRTNISKPFDSNVQDYNSILIQHNKLLRPPRNPRSTLMLSGMGFSGHCTDVALEIVKILNEKHL